MQNRPGLLKRMWPRLLVVSAVTSTAFAWLVGGQAIWLEFSDPPASVIASPNGVHLREHLITFFFWIAIFGALFALAVGALALSHSTWRKANIGALVAAGLFILIAFVVA